jgi:hypothetical protein
VALLLTLIAFLGNMAEAFNFFDPSSRKGCEHVCPPEQVPFFRDEVRHSHSTAPLFTSNGCGSAGIRIGVEEHLTDCCHVHDACYSICGIQRNFCDEQFAKCLKRAGCKRLASKGGNAVERCESNVKMLSTGVSLFGCDAFRTTQMDMCSCFEPGRVHGELLEPMLKLMYQKAKVEMTGEQWVNVVRRASSDMHLTLFRVIEKYNATIITMEEAPREEL